RVDSLAVRSYLASLHRARLASRSLARHLSTLRSFFRWACREGHLEKNPARALPSPRLPRTLPRAMTLPDTERLLTAEEDGPFPERDRALFELLYATGLRVSEAAGLDLEDVDFTARGLRVVGKGNKEGKSPVGGPARDPGAPRPCVPLDHAEVHAPGRRAVEGGLSPGAPEGVRKTRYPHFRMNPGEKWHSTTIVCVRHNGKVAMASDGQVTLGTT